MPLSQSVATPLKISEMACKCRNHSICGIVIRALSVKASEVAPFSKLSPLSTRKPS